MVVKLRRMVTRRGQLFAMPGNWQQGRTISRPPLHIRAFSATA
jgi:hypothetical protein